MEAKSKSKSEKLFEIEKILKKRKVKGKIEYFVKWKGFRMSDCSWEPEKNLRYCSWSVEAFENERKRSMKNGKSSKKSANSRLKKEKKDGDTQSQIIFKKGTLNAFCRGLKAKSIIGVTEVDGMVLYIIDFEGGDKPEVIHSDIATYECPDLVLEFYRDRLQQLNKTESENHDESNN